jgi:putative ABC transport system permease protein
LDVDDRRVWVIGRSVADRVMIPPSQLLEGDLEQATQRLRQNGWATVSTSIATERNLHLDDVLVLPTPAGASHFRVAAITTNLGWVSGAVAINTSDYRRAFETAAPSALQVEVRDGAPLSAAKRSVQQAMGPGLRVETRQEREERYFDLGREGVARLSQIAALLLVAAALAVACALTAMLWQRRPRLAAMRIQGARRGQLWRSLLFEASLVVLVGCIVGTVLGMYGHFLAGRYLRLTTGFSASFSLGGEQLLIATAVVAGVALLVSAIPGYLAANAPIRAGFQE